MNHLAKLLVFLPLLSLGQFPVIDSFQDGNFHLNPKWVGDSAFFEVEEEELKLKGPSQSDSLGLFTAFNPADSLIEWRFKMRLSFSPSQNNQAYFFLWTNGEKNENFEGIFLRLGNSGSPDVWNLVHQTGFSQEILGSGQKNFPNSSGQIFQSKITYKSGIWTVFFDAFGGPYFQEEIKISKNFQFSFGFLGWVCKFSPSNANAFSLDEVYAGKIIEDNEPPIFEHITSFQDSIRIKVNEPIDTTRYPIILWNQDTLELILRTREIIAKHYSGVEWPGLMRVVLLYDLAANSTPFFDSLLTPENPKQHSLLFTEAMIDPYPTVGLPNQEYLEITNNSPQDLNLKWFTLEVNQKRIPLPDFDLSVGESICLNEGLFLQSDSIFLNLDYLPSLTNDELSLGLYWNDFPIHQVHFKASDFEDEPKSMGGWSLEIPSLNQACVQGFDWEFSNQPTGGSPGFLDPHPFKDSDQSLKIRSFSIDSNRTIQLGFNQYLEYYSLDKLELRISPSIHLEKTFPQNPKGEVRLRFGQDFDPNQTYQLEIFHAKSCQGSGLDTLIVFTLPQTPKYGDLRIVEVMIEPNEDQAEFLEIHNRSTFSFDLSELRISVSSDSEASNFFEEITSKSYLINPGDLVLISEEKMPLACETGLGYEVNLPALSNSGVKIVLGNQYWEEIDEIWVEPSFHHPYLSDSKGRSFIRLGEEGENPENWQTCLTEQGFSPGCKDGSPSQTFLGEFHLEPEYISPNLDGFQDYSILYYEFPEEGYLMDISVWNLSGQWVSSPVQSKLCPQRGEISITGTGESGQILPFGNYILLIHAEHKSGESLSRKLPLIIGP